MGLKHRHRLRLFRNVDGAGPADVKISEPAVRTYRLEPHIRLLRHSAVVNEFSDQDIIDADLPQKKDPFLTSSYAISLVGISKELSEGLLYNQPVISASWRQ